MNQTTRKAVFGSNKEGEYKDRGEYHKNIDPNWPYFPVYKEKLKEIDRILRGKEYLKILDAGCGEGVLIEKYRKKGFDIQGFDSNYSSKNIKKGDIIKIPFKEEEFDIVLCLSVLEHLSFEDQNIALKELNRVLKKSGILVLAIPNLAHIASRLSFLFTGKLLRTSELYRHKGDRPISEFITLIKKANFNIIKRKGLFPTFPFICLLTKRAPKKALHLHKIYNILFNYPNWCFENIIICKKLK